MTQSRLISTSSIGVIAGLAIIAFALHKAHQDMEYDPSALIATGLSVMVTIAGLPTPKADETIQNVVSKIDRPLPFSEKQDE